MSDVLIYETGNGGDIIVRGNTIVEVKGYENAPYLAMFAGSDYWGNYLMPATPFTSRTENALNTTPLSSAGRVKIEEAIKTDLAFLNNIPGTKWTVHTTIIGPYRLDIEITIDGKIFSYSWNPDTKFLTYKI